MMVLARFPDGLEHRAGLEVRAADGGKRLEGYAAKFGTEAQIGGFRETILPGAFRGSLEVGADVLALVDHDPGRLLARTSSGTLRLAEDHIGLAFTIDLPGTQLGQDVRVMAERRDIGGMSFGFRVAKGGEAWPRPNFRELRAVNLVEISVVHAHPAYTGTEVHARARGLQAAARGRLLRLWLETV